MDRIPFNQRRKWCFHVCILYVLFLSKIRVRLLLQVVSDMLMNLSMRCRTNVSEDGLVMLGKSITSNRL